jgi:hypothetical protein
MDSPLSNFLFSTNTCTSCLQLAFCRKNIPSSILCVLSEQLLQFSFGIGWVWLCLFTW